MFHSVSSSGVRIVVWWKLMHFCFHRASFLVCGSIFGIVYPIVMNLSSCCVACAHYARLPNWVDSFIIWCLLLSVLWIWGYRQRYVHHSCLDPLLYILYILYFFSVFICLLLLWCLYFLLALNFLRRHLHMKYLSVCKESKFFYSSCFNEWMVSAECT
jgi:hypothetical protein